MTNQLTKKINQILLEKKSQTTNLGLFNGKMGIAIYFFKIAKLKNDDFYYETASLLLDEIFENLDIDMPVNMENGLSGIAFGIEYLIENDYIKNYVDTDELLSEIDDKIFERLSSELIIKPKVNNIDLKELYEISFYLIKRINRTKNNELISIYSKSLIQIVNNIHDSILNINSSILRERRGFDCFWITPIYLIFISEILELNIYNYKMHRVIDEIAPYILSMFPYCNVNRLYLVLAMNKIISLIPSLEEWRVHVNLLEENINIDKLIHEDFPDKSLVIRNGICGVLMFIYYFQNTKTGIDLQEIKKKAFYKIIHSSYWEDEEFLNKKKSIGLLYGISGIALSVFNITKEFKNET